MIASGPIGEGTQEATMSAEDDGERGSKPTGGRLGRSSPRRFVGAKAANLGRLASAGFPVPPGSW